jgi:hypothetical protein
MILRFVRADVGIAVFPVLSQAEVAEFMMAAGIVKGNGKLINDYS